MKTFSPSGSAEPEPVVGAGLLAVLELGLGDGGLVVDVPQGRGLGRVGLAAGQVAQERPLGGPARAVADRLVGVAPVDRQAEPAEQRLEGLLVLDGQPLAELDEALARQADLLVALLERAGVGRGLVGRVVGLARVAADAVVVLDAALGRQAVVVPAHRVEHALAAHPLEARDEVGVGVAEDVADVQAAAHRRRRGVDGVHVGPLGGAVEGVGALLLPDRAPPVLDAVEHRLVGHALGGRGRRLRLAHGTESREGVRQGSLRCAP